MELENIMSIIINLKIIQVQNYIYILQKILQVRKCGLRKCYEFPENNISPKICTLQFIQCYNEQHLQTQDKISFRFL